MDQVLPRDELLSQLLGRLRAAGGLPCSGESLARELSVSRTAVWRGIQRLRRAGYRIAGSPHVGYSLEGGPDVPYPWEVKMLRGPLWKEAPAEYYDSLPSTNDRAKELARAGCPSGTLIIADAQTAGRGRRGRSWDSAAGRGLWCSLVVRPALPPRYASRLIMWAAWAVARGLDRYAPGRVGVKWPNDILIGGGKVAGILLETESEPDRITFAVVGFGINVGHRREDFPPEIRSSATSVRIAAGGSEVARLEVLGSVLAELEALYEAEEPRGFAGVVEGIRPYSLTLGRLVTVHEDGRVWRGKAVSLTPEGMLVVEDEAGARRVVHSADVSVRL